MSYTTCTSEHTTTQDDNRHDTYDKAPRPMLVNTLMAKRVFLGLSLGNKPVKLVASMTGSSKRVFSACNPIRCDNSCMVQHDTRKNAERSNGNRTHECGEGVLTISKFLMKIREDDVVSSSVRRMYSNTLQSSASEYSKCEKNLATLRMRFVSYRWIVAYCRKQNNEDAIKLS